MGATDRNVSRKLTLLKLLSKYVNQNSLKQYYNSYVLPLFDFGCVVWGNTTNANLTRLVKLQKRAARIILKEDFIQVYRFPSHIDFKKCRKEIASALNDFGNRWCKREYVEPNALKEGKVSIFKIVDQRIKFYSQNTNLLPPKPKFTFRHLKQGIQDFHGKYVLVPADKAANNVVVV